MVLEDMLGKRVIVVGTEKHPKYKHLNVHYVGTLRPAPKGELRLSNWNDRIFCYYNTCGEDVGLDTRPTDRSKDVVIPREKVRHIHELKKSILVGEYGRATTKDVFHLWSSDDED